MIGESFKELMSGILILLSLSRNSRSIRDNVVKDRNTKTRLSHYRA